MSDSASLMIKTEIILTAAHLEISMIKAIVNAFRDIKNYNFGIHNISTEKLSIVLNELISGTKLSSFMEKNRTHSSALFRNDANSIPMIWIFCPEFTDGGSGIV